MGHLECPSNILECHLVVTKCHLIWLDLTCLVHLDIQWVLLGHIHLARMVTAICLTTLSIPICQDKDYLMDICNIKLDICLIKALWQ